MPAVPEKIRRADAQTLSRTLRFFHSRPAEGFPVRHRFGDRERFAAQIDSVREELRVRVVDLWAAGVSLCREDNAVYVPAFCLSVEAAVTWLLSDGDGDRALPHPDLSAEENHRRLRAGGYEERSPYRFLDWGPTTDGLFALLFRRGGEVVLTVQFVDPPHEEQVFVAEMPERELLRVLHQTVCVLRNG